MQLLGTLAAASITGVGLAVGGTIGATVMAGIGINLSSTVIRGGCFNLKEKWLNSRHGLVNHDLKNALSRAFGKALSSLETKYFESELAGLLESYEKDSIRDLFEELKKNAEGVLRVTLNQAQTDTRVRYLLLSKSTVDSDEVWDHLVGDELISKYNRHLKDFVRKHLVNEAIFWFGEELKTDNRECNKAWRAFQRMILEGIYDDVRAVRASQEQIDRDLSKLDSLREQMDELRDVFDRRLPDELFQRELQGALEQISSTLHGIAETNASIAENVDVIGADVKTLLKRTEAIPFSSSDPCLQSKELAEIRTSLLTADSAFELSSAFYRVDEFLANNPSSSEARLLKDQINAARDGERKLRLQLEEVGFRTNLIENRRRSKLISIALLTMALLLLSFLLLRWLGLL